MAEGNLRTISYVIALITCIIAGYRLDCIVVGLECAFVFITFYASRKYNAKFDDVFLKVASIISVALIAILLIYESGVLDSYYYGDIQWIYIIECLIVPVLSFDIGFMVATLFDKYTDSQFSKRWLIVFALVFSLAVSGITMFTVGFGLWFQEMPFFRDECRGGDHLTDHILMVAPDCAVVTAVASAIVAKRLTKGIDRSVFLMEVSE